MRSHGLPDFPDPASSPLGFKEALNVRSPASRAAYTLCSHLLPNDGQPPNSAGSAPSRAQTTAELAFAGCMRSHAFSNFPDPNTRGELTHEMLATAGINLHQPALMQAADACASVTHGFLTRADIARFIAGQ